MEIDFTLSSLDEQTLQLSFLSSYISPLEQVKIIVPSDYLVADGRYPTVYLLHGWSGNYHNWEEEIGDKLRFWADLYQMIIIMPDGGYASWYIDAPCKATSCYQSMIHQELVPLIDINFQTINSPAKRAIGGLSMGGFGALSLASRAPELWGAAASMSCGMDLVAKAKLSKEIDVGLVELLGGDISLWHEYSIFERIHALKEHNTAVFFDCGYSDENLAKNRELHQAMLSVGLAHEYLEMPGSHDWFYWERSANYHFLFFNDFFTRPNLINKTARGG